MGPRLPLEKFFQYRVWRLAARQDSTSQARPSKFLSLHSRYTKIQQMVTEFQDAAAQPMPKSMLQVKRVTTWIYSVGAMPPTCYYRNKGEVENIRYPILSYTFHMSFKILLFNATAVHCILAKVK